MTKSSLSLAKSNLYPARIKLNLVKSRKLLPGIIDGQVKCRSCNSKSKTALFKDQRGSTIVITLMVLLVFTILAAAFLSTAFFEEKSAIIGEKHKQAYYLARSGQEVAFSMIKKNEEELNHLPGYIYGSLSKGFIYVRGVYDNSHSAESIVTVVEGHDGSGVITSYGNIEGVVEKISFTFNYGTVLEPGVPPPPPPEGLNAGSADGDIVSWYNSNNGNIVRGGGTYDGAVTFQNGANETVIILQNSTSTLSAYSMYFRDMPISLQVSTNSILNLISDLLSFSGKIDIDFHTSSSSHDGSLILKVNRSQILGQDIGGRNNIKYGVIYLGDAVRLGGVPFSGIEANSYYYFPDGVDLNTQSGINQLIKINELSSVDMVKLGIGSSSGGINPGLYH